MTIFMLGNTIYDNYYGNLTSGPVTVKLVNFNRFIHVTHRAGRYPTYP